jgi:beta-mannosidase
LDKSLTSGWYVLQDVHDAGEELRLFEDGTVLTDVGHQLSEWEPIDRLQHLQILFAGQPYWGRELRYFNHAPWWYVNEFVAEETGDRATLEFSNVDYFCRVWLNGQFLGEHEARSTGSSSRCGPRGTRRSTATRARCGPSESSGTW